MQASAHTPEYAYLCMTLSALIGIVTFGDFLIDNWIMNYSNYSTCIHNMK